MEKYARQAVSEGVKNADDLRVGGDSEIYRVLNLHYNRNNHIEVNWRCTRNINVIKRYESQLYKRNHLFPPPLIFTISHFPCRKEEQRRNGGPTTCAPHDSPIKFRAVFRNRAVRVEISMGARKLAGSRRQRNYSAVGHDRATVYLAFLISRNAFKRIRVGLCIRGVTARVANHSYVSYFPIVGRNLLSPRRNDRWLYLQRRRRRRWWRSTGAHVKQLFNII